MRERPKKILTVLDGDPDYEMVLRHIQARGEWPSPSIQLLPPELLAKITPDHVPHVILGTPCWLWDGELNRNGYGRTNWEGRRPVVHRVTFTLLIGPIPDGLILDHLCRVRRCCNPHHAEPVTHLVNTLRGNATLFTSLDKASQLLQCA